MLQRRQSERFARSPLMHFKASKFLVRMQRHTVNAALPSTYYTSLTVS